MMLKNGNACGNPGEKKFASRSQEIRECLGTLAGRDLRLVSVSLLLLLVVSVGVLGLIFPNLMPTTRISCADLRLLPQLLFGLMSLIVFFNVYVVLHKREMSATTRRLVDELIFNERMEAVSLIDPTTQLFNRRAMEQMLTHEVARTNRLDATLSLLVLDISDFEAISNRLGTQETEHVLYETAQLVRNTFRSSDMVFRHKETQFLVVMPHTSEQQVDFAIKRLEGEVARHNSEFRSIAELAFGCGAAQFTPCSRITDTLLSAEHKAFLHKHDFVPVF